MKKKIKEKIWDKLDAIVTLCFSIALVSLGIGNLFERLMLDEHEAKIQAMFEWKDSIGVRVDNLEIIIKDTVYVPVNIIINDKKPGGFVVYRCGESNPYQVIADKIFKKYTNRR